MNWLVESFPPCTHHAFIAYAAEDREDLARPIRDELKSRCGIEAWIDELDYPSSATDEFLTLRESILRSRFVVYLVTKSSLKQGRGWQAIERSYGELLQRSVEHDGLRHYVELPLFFVPRTNASLSRSCWRHWIENNSAKFYPPHEELEVGAIVQWATSHISAFVGLQLNQSRDLHKLFSDSRFLEFLRARPGLVDRLTGKYPDF